MRENSFCKILCESQSLRMLIQCSSGMFLIFMRILFSHICLIDSLAYISVRYFKRDVIGKTKARTKAAEMQSVRK